MSTVVSRSSLFAVAVTAACYSPNNDPNATSNDGDESSTGTDASATMTTTTDASATGMSGTMSSSGGESGEVDGTIDPATSGAPETSADSSSGTPIDPFCGDGTVDPGEDCDDGDDNALTGACRPDCNMARCGDGDIWAGVEDCDDGDGDNVLEIGACAPDCSRVIEERVIEGGDFIMGGGDLGGNPVGFVDGTCDVGYKAIFVVPGVREASDTPFAGDNQLDWVLTPYTAYVTSAGVLVWITDDVALLGVRDGAAQPLLAPIYEENFLSAGLISGLDDDWTSAVSNTCNGWTSESQNIDARRGDPTSVVDYLNAGTSDCADWSQLAGGFWFGVIYVYCVEQ